MPDIYDFIKELAQFELEYTDNDGAEHCLKTYVKRVYDDYIFISSPEKDNLSVNIADEQKISVIFKTEKGFLSADSVVLGKQLDSSMQGIKISFPLNSRFIERRAYSRVPFNIDIEVIKVLDSKDSKEVFNAVTNDISGSGLSYISEMPLDNYYDILCRIYLHDGEDPVNVRCEHISSRKTNRDGRELTLTTLAYVDITDEQVSRIVRACFKYKIQNK